MIPSKNVSVPLIIHHIIGKEESSIIKKCLNSWRALTKKEFTIRVWTDSEICEYLFDNYRFVFDCFINARNHAEAADIGRYLIVHAFGGYFVDWDVELLDIDLFFKLAGKYPSGYMLFDPLNGSLASEYFCALQAEPFLLNLVKDIVEIYNDGGRDSLFTPSYSGPFRMKDSLEKHPVTWMTSIPVKDVFAYDYNEIRNIEKPLRKAAMIHYWVHSWL